MTGSGTSIGLEVGGADSYGIYVDSNSSNALRVLGPNSGVSAALFSQGRNGHAVFGEGNATARAGISGTHSLPGGGPSNRWAIYAFGDIGATGAKSFVQPHPNDPTLAVAFVCLEGNECGTYFRGTGRIVGGSAEIEIPDEWKLVTAEAGITVQVTPAQLAVMAVPVKTRNRILVAANADVEFDYFVNGLRIGYTDRKSIIPNAMFRPEVIGVEFGRHLSPGVRDMMVRNGTLNADYTPNLETAARLGWKLRMPTPEEVNEAVQRGAGK